MTNNTNTEQILLYSPGEATNPDSNSLRNITLELAQISKWKGGQKLFRVYEDKFLSVIDNSGRKPKTYWVNLVHLDTHPRVHRHINWRWTLASVILLFSAGMLTAGLLYTEWLKSVPYIAVLISLLYTSSVLCILLMTYKAKNNFIFYAAHGKVPLVEFFNNSPNRSQFGEFIISLIQRINKAKTKCYYNDVQLLASELGEHRRLRDEGVFPDEVYQKAKGHIFSQHAAQKQKRARHRSATPSRAPSKRQPRPVSQQKGAPG